MKVKVRVFGTLAEYLGGTHHELALSQGATLRSLLETVDACWGDRLPDDVWDRENKSWRGRVMLMLDGRDITDLTTRIRDGGEVYVLMPLGGG